MSTHIDKRSEKRVNKEIILGKCALVGVLAIGGWCIGDGIGHIVHPIRHTRRVSTLRHFKSHHSKQETTAHNVTMPLYLQGSYVSYLPIRTQALSPYFQVASLVHVKQHAIYQKIFIVWKHRTKQPNTSVIKRPRIRHRKVTNTIIKSRHKIQTHKPKSLPYIVRGKQLFYHSALPYLSDNFSSCVKPEHLTKSSNGYSFSVFTKSINGYYTDQHVKQFFGNEKPYWFGPSDHSLVKLIQASHNHWICNGLLYHKISARRAKQLLHRAPATNATFMNY